jgi:hypothetical protein
MKNTLLAYFIINFLSFWSQKNITISGGIDLYFGFNPLDLKQEKTPIYVNSNELNSVSINLGLIDFKYQLNKFVRLQLTPAIGSYMYSNYASEKKYFRYFYESSIGISPRKRNNEWIEIGIFSSPYTFETPRSWDQIAYTRSIAPEYVPYYSSGIRYQNEISKMYKLSLFLFNGWQKIEWQKKIPSLGTQIEWKKDKEYISWTTYSGNEKTDINKNFGFRFFSELSWAHQAKKYKTQVCVYGGIQSIKNHGLKNWWQINGIFDFKIGKNSDAYIRYEYFHDPNKIQIQTASTAIGFTGHVSSLGFNQRINEHLMLRLEGKTLFSRKENELFYINTDYSNYLPLLFGNITIQF